MIPDSAGLKPVITGFQWIDGDIKECKKNPNPITFGPLISENTVAADKPHH
jgi:hypothetical protein